MKGLGEKFAPDLQTGTGNFSVPISVPQGRNGLTPDLSLIYSTGNGNGPFGVGWKLSVPSISRKTSHGVPLYRDASSDPALADTFVLTGADDLVRVSDSTAGRVRYRPRTEGLFGRVERIRDDTNDYWEVRSKNGLLSRYGTVAQRGTDPTVIRDPGRTDHVFAWYLSRTADTYGNFIEYEYVRDGGENARYDQLYLSAIRYGDFDDQDVTKFLISIAFAYDSGDRLDALSDRRPGFEVVTRNRCSAIHVTTHFERDRPVRSYRFTYDEAPNSGISLLTAVAVNGYDEDGTELTEFPPLELGYTHFDLTRRHDLVALDADLPRFGASSAYELVDLSGDGLPDILEMKGVTRYWTNLGSGRFDLPRSMSDAPAGVALSDAGVQMLDADGDGRLDLMVTTGQISGYFPLRHDGGWDRRSFRRYKSAPTFVLEDPEVKLVDLDGDGITDAIRSGARLECFFNRPAEGGWQQSQVFERRDLHEFPNVNFSDPRVRFADMSGDGLQDVVLVHDGEIDYWPSYGHGRWGSRIRMARSPRLPYDFDPARLLLGDVDGDGLADAVYVDDSHITVWLNRGGHSWSDPVEIDGTPPVAAGDSIRLVDLMGSGIAGVLWSSTHAPPQRASAFFLDLTRSSKPYLLNRVDNKIGCITSIAYASSTEFYQRDRMDRTTRWRTPLPFPVQVVKRVEAADLVSGGTLVTEYRYHHGYWDGVEREFRGFAFVEQFDSERGMTTPPALTRTWFDVGPTGGYGDEPRELDLTAETWSRDPSAFVRDSATSAMLQTLTTARMRRDALRSLRGRMLRTELYALDGTAREHRPYSVKELQYGIRFVASDVYLPYLIAERTTAWDRGEDPLTRMSFHGAYDQYGQAQEQISIAAARGRNWREEIAAPASPYLATFERTDYAYLDAERYIVDRIARQTHYEVVNDGTSSALALATAVFDRSAVLRIVGQTVNFYDGPPFRGLEFQQIGDHGALTRCERLVTTQAEISDAYPVGDGLFPASIPPYFTTMDPSWPPEYPAEFVASRTRTDDTTRSGLAMTALGLGYSDGTGEFAEGFFAAIERRRYDVHDTSSGRGLKTVTRSPTGGDTQITYEEPYHILPITVRQIGPGTPLTTSATYDYRFLQPREITDANGNRSAVRFTPSGLVAATALLGKTGANVGDTVDQPSVAFVYDFFSFVRDGSPIYTHTIKRQEHRSALIARVNGDRAAAGESPLTPAGVEALFAAGEIERFPERFIQSREYSDGFGRIVQTRAQTSDELFGDPLFGGGVLPVSVGSTATAPIVPSQNTSRETPNVIVSTWEIYDNKGRPIERYEPFFSTGWDYRPPNVERDVFSREVLGQSVRMQYDALGNLELTTLPSGAQQRIVRGVPGSIAAPDLTDPTVFEPTPWESYTYDGNDNAGRTHPADSASYQTHWNTPSSAVIDALGRVVRSVDRTADQSRVTVCRYDITGNLRSVVDPFGREAFSQSYDLAKRPIRIESIDAGSRRVFIDAAGNAVETRDGKGARVFRSFDQLSRPVRVWASDDSNAPIRLVERVQYGDDPAVIAPAAAAAINVAGKVYRHDDEAGTEFLEYDMRGNIAEKRRQVLATSNALDLFGPAPPGWTVAPFRVDWNDPPSRAQPLTITYEYDALNRAIAIRMPARSGEPRRVLRPRYDRAGLLRSVALDADTYVDHIAYNARGQRTLVAFGNGVLTRYAYDPTTFALARTRSEAFQRNGDTYQPAGSVLQDLSYTFDFAGNALTISHRTAGSGVPDSIRGEDRLDRTFKYDALYRLESATGRETDLVAASPAPPWIDAPRSSDATRARGYEQHYEYDLAGNLTKLRHVAGTSSYTSQYTIDSSSHRTATMRSGGETYTYGYDANGNVVAENTERHFSWDHSDRLIVFAVQTAGSEPSMYAQYFYDSAGRRTLKVVRRQGGAVEATAYIDGVFEQCVWRAADGSTGDTATIHLVDGEMGLARVRVGVPHPDDQGPAIEYHLVDHLGNTTIAIGGATPADRTFLNREEFFPYGSTSFGSYSRKRFRFIGRERDEESGLSYHGARYFAPWLARWISADPGGIRDGTNLYSYARSNPLRLRDPNGRQSETAVRSEVHVPHNLDTEKWQKAAEAGRDEAKGMLEKHRRQLSTHGVGTHYGTNSDFAGSSPAERRKAIRGKEVSMPEQTNCIEFVRDSVTAALRSYLQQEYPSNDAHDAVGRLTETLTFIEIFQDSRSKNVPSGRGTTTGRFMHDSYGWFSLLVTKDPTQTSLSAIARAKHVPPDGRTHITGADTGLPVDVTTPIDAMMVPKGTRVRSEGMPVMDLDTKKLSKITFAIGIALDSDPDNGWGYHTFVIADGRVMESHWNDEPTDKGVFTSKSINEFMKTWETFVLVIPPGQFPR